MIASFCVRNAILDAISNAWTPLWARNLKRLGKFKDTTIRYSPGVVALLTQSVI